MEELTIKKKNIKTEEFFLDVKVEEDILQEDVICQEVTTNYKQEFDREIEIVKHELLEANYDDAQSYPVCKKIKSDKKEVESVANEEKKIKSIQYRVSRNNINKLKSLVLDVRGKTNRFKCSKCDYSSVRKSDMTNHVMAVHDKEKPFKCSDCDYTCAQKGALTMHVRAVHDKEKPFKCSECDYSCVRKDRIILHVREVHNKEKPFKCGKCNYSCASKSNITRHIRAVHDKRENI